MLTTDVTQVSSAAPFEPDTTALGREDFLKMLIAQLENQDPLNPQDSSQFTAQLAQFSSLEQEMAMRSSLERISTLLDRGDSATAIDLIGKQVLAESAHFELSESGDVTLRFDLATSSDSTRVKIRNARGDLVAELDMGARSGGLGQGVWDGRNSAGVRLGSGVYSMEIDANLNANTVASTPLILGTVSGADVSTSQPELRLGEIVVPIAGLREVTQAPSRVTP